MPLPTTDLASKGALVFSGTLLLFYVFFQVWRFIQLIKKYEPTTGWRILLTFLGAFILGFSYVLIRIFTAHENEISLLVAVLFFFGAIFALLALKTGMTSAQKLLALNTELQSKIDEKTSELLARNAQLEGFFEHSPDGIVVINAQGMIVIFNGQAEALFGYSKKEAIGQPIEILVPIALRETHVPRRQSYISNPSTRPMGSSLDLSAQRKNGSIFPVEVSLSPIPNGTETLFMASVRDISARKAIEQTLSHQRDQLIVASKLASIGQLAGGVAHELNTPLAAISLTAEHLLEQGQQGLLRPEELIHAAKSIKSLVDRSAKIIRSLLAFTRTGPQETRQRFLYRDLIEEARSLLEDPFKNHQISFTHSETPPDLEGFGIPRQLIQVIYALLENAMLAVLDCPERWIRVETLQKKDCLEMSFIDSGHGVSEKDREKIFDPFFTTRKIGQGQGLGLSLSYGIIQEHGGQIFLDSTSPHTRFIIRLPIALTASTSTERP